MGRKINNKNQNKAKSMNNLIQLNNKEIYNFKHKLI